MAGHSPSKTGVSALVPGHAAAELSGSVLAQLPSLLNAASATFSGVMPKCR